MSSGAWFKPPVVLNAAESYSERAMSAWKLERAAILKKVYGEWEVRWSFPFFFTVKTPAQASKYVKSLGRGDAWRLHALDDYIEEPTLSVPFGHAQDLYVLATAKLRTGEGERVFVSAQDASIIGLDRVT